MYKSKNINQQLFNEINIKSNIEWRTNNSKINNKQEKYKNYRGNIFNSKIDNIPGPNIKHDSRFISKENYFIKKNKIDFPQYKSEKPKQIRSIFKNLKK